MPFFAPASDLETFRDGLGVDLGAGSYHMKSNPSVGFGVEHGGTRLNGVGLPISARHEYYTEAGVTGSDVDDVETNVYVEWGGAEPREWSRYLRTYRTEGGDVTAESIPEAEAPAALRDLEYTTTLKGRANYQAAEDVAPDDWDTSCWACDDAAKCAAGTYAVVLESGATVRYVVVAAAATAALPLRHFYH